MHSKIITLAAILGMISLPVFAEPTVQAGETLESLSKVRISTTVNGQPGSIKQLAAAGQIKVAEADLPVSVEDIDGIMEETAAPAAEAKVAAPAAEKKPVEPATKVEAATTPAVAPASAPAAATEELVNVEDIDPAQPV